MTEHTRGPWRIISRHPGFVSFRGDPPDTPIGDINIYSVCKEESEANLALILAAPDLLRALEVCKIAIKLGLTSELKPYAEAWSGLLYTVDTAIAKSKEVTP